MIIVVFICDTERAALERTLCAAVHVLGALIYNWCVL